MTTGAPVALSVMIATYNRAALVRDAIEALRAQVTPEGLTWEVVVVDNNSADDTHGAVEALARGAAAPIRYLFEGRQGKSHALNAGLRAARGAVIAFTDDDVLPAPDWVATAARVLEAWDADGAGGRILPRWEAAPPDWVTGDVRLLHWLGVMEHARPAVLSLPLAFEPQVWGANMVFRRSVLEAAGGFDTRRGPVGARRFCDEDIEMVARLLGAGRRIVYDPALLVHHRVPAARLAPGHFRRVAWEAGIGRAADGVAGPGPRLLGAPRWRYRQAVVSLLRCGARRLARRPADVAEEMNFLESAGAIWGGLRARP